MNLTKNDIYYLRDIPGDLRKNLLDVRFVRDDVDVDGHEESKGSVTEGNCGEKFRILGRRTNHSLCVTQNHLKTAANIL